MTPESQIKAKELFNKMKGFRVKHSHSKKCAIIAVEEKIQLLQDLDSYFHEAGHDRETLSMAMELELDLKKALEKL